MEKKLQKNISEEEPINIKSNWICTFNDMMTLLMVFFVLIFSLSTMNVQGIHSARMQLQSGLGIFEAGKMTSVGVVAPLTPYDIGNETFTKTIEASIELLEKDSGIDVSFSDAGIKIILNNAVLFESGTADINRDGAEVLENLASSILSKISNSILITGHTDTDSIHTKKYPSNWELSTARAVNVLKCLAATGKLLPKRLAAAGYGDVTPVAPNDSIEGKRKNRRVEIIITTDEDINSE